VDHFSRAQVDHFWRAAKLIAGIASQLGAVLVHKDPEFEALNGTVDLEALPYK
jgi:hypothetical protein